jgi:hypothetical protein
MTTPNGRPSLRSCNDDGPSGSFLRQLLDEINGTVTPITRRVTTPATPGSLPPSRGTGSGRAGSIWVGGTAVAQDAREKLRAADEARLQKTSSREGCNEVWAQPPAGTLTSHSHTVPSSPVHPYYGLNSNAAPSRPRPTLSSLQIPSSRFITQPTMLDNDIARANSPLMFVDSDISSTPSPSEAPSSAVTVSSSEATTAPSRRGSWCRDFPHFGKRSRSPEAMPRMITKKMRTMTLPDTWCPTASGNNTSMFQNTEFIERAALAPFCSYNPQDQLPELSSFRPVTTTSPGAIESPPRPKTPTWASAQGRSATSSPEPRETPSFARPLHLTDSSIIVAKNAQGDEWVNNISIYKYVHGDEWRRNSLCQPCFRRHGQFQRILTHGYEACGLYEALDSHFWEPSDGASTGEMDLVV